MSNPGMISTELHSPLYELKSLTMTGYLIGLVVILLYLPQDMQNWINGNSELLLNFNCILLRHGKIRHFCGFIIIMVICQEKDFNGLNTNIVKDRLSSTEKKNGGSENWTC